ncbi:MAG: 3-demethylubiquinone-9 3-methyltransferase [Hyphomicrobiales bacterium]|nr:3-demethylubiquinone-9 3-methyltransferase [Hyphomicrobiales bacterium]
MKLSPCLAFGGDAEEAMNFYLAAIPGSRAAQVMRAGESGPGPAGALIAATLEIGDDRLLLLNGPDAAPSMAVSLFLSCDSQEQVDRLWDSLCAGGKPIQCGWLTDRYGVSWQIVPKGTMELLNHPDRARAQRAMQAMMRMVKLDIHELERAADGR